MRSLEEINKLILLIPEDWRRICNPGPLGCACMGCLEAGYYYYRKIDAEPITDAEFEMWSEKKLENAKR